MPQISVTIAGRAYRMTCGEGEQDHILGLARRLDSRINSLRTDFGEIGDQRLTMMAAITVTDELSEAEKRIAALEGKIAALDEDRRIQAEHVAAMAEVVATVLDGVTADIDRAAQVLAGEGRT